jgi:hypothetical protein
MEIPVYPLEWRLASEPRGERLGKKIGDLMDGGVTRKRRKDSILGILETC